MTRHKLLVAVSSRATHPDFSWPENIVSADGHRCMSNIDPIDASIIRNIDMIDVLTDRTG